MAENNLPDETDKKDVLDSAGYHINHDNSKHGIRKLNMK